MESNGDVLNMENIFRDINKALTEEDILMLSPLQLAYIGDGVYELFIRTYLLDGKKNVNEMNKYARKLVNAKAQAGIVTMLEEFLTDKERKIVKRGRNAKVHSSPKNMDIMDYKYATGFEALVGYLYLKKEYGRLYKIMDKILYDEKLLRIDGIISNIKNREIGFIKMDLEKIFKAEGLGYENFIIRKLDRDEACEVIIDFPLDILNYSRLERKLASKFIGYIEEEGLVFEGSWPYKFKGGNNEG